MGHSTILRGALAGCVLAAGVAAQQPVTPRPGTPQTTYRTGIELVQVDAVVLDRDRRPVRGLTAADFAVFEDGKRRPVEAFTAIELPAASAPPAASAGVESVESDLTVNSLPPAGRLVVVLRGRGIRPVDMPLARRTAAAVIEQLAPGDLAAVMDGSGFLRQNFTADRNRLLEAVNRTFGGYDGTLEPLPGARAGDDDPERAERENTFATGDTECRCGVCVLDAMTRIADAVREVPQRHKMLVFLGDYVPVAAASRSRSDDCDVRVRAAREKLLEATRLSNLVIHAIDSRGLEVGGRSSAEFRDMPGDAVQQAFEAVGRHQRQQDLSVYPAETGGRVILDTNTPADLVPAVFTESSSYYVLAFAPSNPRSGRRDHAIEVKVANPAFSVHARRSYVQPSARPARETDAEGPAPAATRRGAPSPDEAISGVLPIAGLTVSAVVTPFAVPGNTETAVFVTVDISQVDAEPLPGGTEHTEILIAALDAAGRRVASHRQQMDFSMTASGSELQYQALSRLDLKPGRYEIRAAVRHLRANRTGSVYAFVDVPDFASQPLALSGIVVHGGRMNLVTPESAFAAVLPLAPTATREFGESDELRLFARVYQRGVPRRPVSVRITIADAEGRTALQRSAALIPAAFDEGGAADCSLAVPAGELPTGQYRLAIEAAMDDTTTSRGLRFTIR